MEIPDPLSRLPRFGGKRNRRSRIGSGELFFESEFLWVDDLSPCLLCRDGRLSAPGSTSLESGAFYYFRLNVLQRRNAQQPE